jgi:7-carboxy-7-deazaguanine synthase (Cx14CxxC type)
MSYLVNEVFLTIQGEGVHVGRTAVFCRFSRCNLWTGREADRHKAVCQFCDTDFTSYTEYTLVELVDKISNSWNWGTGAEPMVVFTGGEPSLQLDETLLWWLHAEGFYIAIETNGTRALPVGIDWICVSPKTPKLNVYRGDELKLVYPQQGRMQPETYANHDFEHFWLSPMDGPDLADNTKLALEYVLTHPQWRLNTQVHKLIGVR